MCSRAHQVNFTKFIFSKIPKYPYSLKPKSTITDEWWSDSDELIEMAVTELEGDI